MDVKRERVSAKINIVLRRKYSEFIRKLVYNSRISIMRDENTYPL